MPGYGAGGEHTGASADADFLRRWDDESAGQKLSRFLAMISSFHRDTPSLTPRKSRTMLALMNTAASSSPVNLPRSGVVR